MNFSKIRIHRQRGKKFFLHSLHLKVTAGYAFIIGVLIAIVFIMRGETNKLILVETGEQQREASCGLIYQISGKLLDLTIPGELLPLWDKADFERYYKDTRSTIVALEELKCFYPALDQCSRIDSVRLLLEEKEIQIGKLYESFNIRSKDERNHNSIPAPHTDRLKIKNQELNTRLDRIIHDFEREAIKQTKSEHELRYKIRQTSFRTLSICMAVGFLLVAIFY